MKKLSLIFLTVIFAHTFIWAEDVILEWVENTKNTAINLIIDDNITIARRIEDGEIKENVALMITGKSLKDLTIHVYNKVGYIVQNVEVMENFFTTAKRTVLLFRFKGDFDQGFVVKNNQNKILARYR